MCKHGASCITKDTGGTYLLLRFWGRKRSLVHDSTSCLQCVWHSKEFVSNMAVSMSSCTCVFKPVTGKVYEVTVNFKVNKSTPGAAQRWTWGCPSTPPWKESCVLCFVSHKRAILEPPLRLTEASESSILHEPGFDPFMHTQLYPTWVGMHASDSHRLTGDVNCFQERAGDHPQSSLWAQQLKEGKKNLRKQNSNWTDVSKTLWRNWN